MNQPFHVKALRVAKDRCIEVKWNKTESGACYVNYEVKFKNASGNYLYTETGYNIAEIQKCNLTNILDITDVQLTVSFKTTKKNFTAKVFREPGQ